MNRMKKILILLAALAVMFTVTDVFARRGGSFGFRGGFGRRSFSSRSFSPRGGSYHGRGFGFFPVFMPFGFGGGFFTFLIFGAIIYLIVTTLRKRQQGGSDGYGNSERSVVARLTVAFFATEKDLQVALAQLAQQHPPGVSQSDAQAYLLRETALLMLRHIEAANKVAFEQHKGLAEPQTRSIFEGLATRMRSAFDQEGIRRDDMGLHMATGKDDNNASGVAQYVVVSIIVAYTEPASIIDTVASISELQTALQNIASIGPDRLLGMEVIWDPESPDGVLDQEAMDRSYPDLLTI